MPYKTIIEYPYSIQSIHRVYIIYNTLVDRHPDLIALVGTLPWRANSGLVAGLCQPLTPIGYPALSFGNVPPQRRAGSEVAISRSRWPAGRPGPTEEGGHSSQSPMRPWHGVQLAASGPERSGREAEVCRHGCGGYGQSLCT